MVGGAVADDEFESAPHQSLPVAIRLLNSLDRDGLQLHIDADLCQVALNEQGHSFPKREILRNRQ